MSGWGEEINKSMIIRVIYNSSLKDTKYSCFGTVLFAYSVNEKLI